MCCSGLTGKLPVAQSKDTGPIYILRKPPVAVGKRLQAGPALRAQDLSGQSQPEFDAWLSPS